MQSTDSKSSKSGAADASAMAAMFGGRQPDPDMAAVLQAMQASGAKPIETLDAKA